MFSLGPLKVRVADAFGMVEISRSFTEHSKLVVTPKVATLPATHTAADWLGAGDRRMRIAATAGEDDVAPRPYRDGDDLRRVHWRSTARHGELMVRREEQPWHSRATVFLDTRSIAHAGAGISSSFEYAVSAAASIGVHLANQQFEMQMITDGGPVAAAAMFEETMLDVLAAARPSRGTTLARGLGALSASPGGLVVAVAGRLDPTQASELARSCSRAKSAVAVLLSVLTWEGHASDAARAGSPEAARILAQAGWQVLTVTAGTPLAEAWGRLRQAAAPAATTATTATTATPVPPVPPVTAQANGHGGGAGATAGTDGGASS
jgi:uncharacterized protein (DUF58 family)